MFYCRRVGEKVKSFPTACEGSTVPLEVGPPLRFVREAPTERLRGEPRRGRCGGLSYKIRETTSTRAYSPQRADATHRRRPEKRTSASSNGI